MVLLGEIRRQVPVRAKALALLLLLGLLAVIIVEQNNLNTPWWSYIKDFVVILLSLTGFLRAQWPQRSLTIWDQVQPPREPDLITENGFHYTLEAVIPVGTSIRRAECTSADVTTMQLSELGDEALVEDSGRAVCDLQFEGQQGLSLVLRLPNATAGTYQVVGNASLSLSVFLAPGIQSLAIKYPINAVVTVED